MESALNSGDTAWLLTAAALVFLMIPGLALFYGGMVRSKSVLNMMMMVMGAMFVVGILWVLFGYSMAFGTSQSSLVGSFTEYFGLEALLSGETEDGYPPMADVAFQAMFACLTTALIAGAIADRTKYNAWLIFAGIWATLVYFPVAHWVWGDGWIGQIDINGAEVIDFAGGTAVHINAGAAALALAVILGARLGWPKTPMRPQNLTLVMLGAGLLWFGWFGFNAGSAYAADNASAVVFVNTIAATCAAALGWLLVEKLRDGHATSLGAASGIVAGLVAITPACDSVTPIGALVVGVTAGVLCSLIVAFKYKLKLDDSLDVVGIHLVGGLIGTLMIGLIARDTAPAEVNGLFFGGGIDQLTVQAIGAFSVLLYSFIATVVIALIIRATIGFRAPADDEYTGVDLTEHGETAYDLGDSGAGGSFAGVGHGAREKLEDR